jgi:hypothetical protein
MVMRDYGLPPDRKTDVDGWPICPVCGVGRSRQVTEDQATCYGCWGAAAGATHTTAPKAALPWPYANDRSG